MRRLLLITLILLAGLNISLLAKSKPAKQLEQNLEQWQEFRWLGIIQVQSSVFSLRKNYVFAKSRDAVRLDVLDSGVMGLQAKPFVTLYLKDSIIFDAPTIKELSGVDLNWFVPKGMIAPLVQFADSLQAKQKEILSTRKVTSARTVFTFDKKFRLSSIVNTAGGFEANIVYNRRSQPTKMLVKYKGEQIAEVLINEREYKDIAIEPLVPSTEGINLEEMLQNIPLDELNLEFE
ncbi:MAG: hypothetical protein FJ041_02485 [Candidatus Cloacimonetes bacterium]|nr:hypothetical protein [Candidatus Cloacimonadota bacterium]